MDTGGSSNQARSSPSKARERNGKEPSASGDNGDNNNNNNRNSSKIAHTLTACCRCRSRKTKCDPTLPKCLPCERSGAVCEYFDAAKERKISRTYVIRLQEKVRELEAKLGAYTDDVWVEDTEDMVRPGGLVRLDEKDDTPRFLGPSSGIAMTRLVMEEAKKYTDTRTIREIVPEVQLRVHPEDTGPKTKRKKSYPMISAVPALELPVRSVTSKLVEVFNQKAQYLLPTLHEPTFEKDLADVYRGSTDHYQNFLVKMVLAISMQKLDVQYSGLADSYYLAAMAHIEYVLPPKDIKTLQCLVLIAQYSLLTPTRTAIYYIVGLAVRICQQLGLNEEETVVRDMSTGVPLNPLQLDMRRRLSWIVLSMEFGLAHSLGRPNAYATGQDRVDVKFFDAVDDQYITPNGILPGPPSAKKIVAIHFFKMRLLQAEIRRKLYQSKLPEPQSDEHPWFAHMQQKLDDWYDTCPLDPSWAKPWFKGRYNTMVVFLYRPSPQVPRPSLAAITRCYDAVAYNITVQGAQMEMRLVEVTWIFLQTLFMAVNTILWTVTFPHIRAAHSKEELESHLATALNVISKCSERWPGTASASELYEKISKAILKSYDLGSDSSLPPSVAANSPQSLVDASSPNSDISNVTGVSIAHSVNQSQWNAHEPAPTFGQVFDQPITEFPAATFSQSMPPAYPSFRLGSIFASPPLMQADRRFSYVAPEYQQQDLPNPWDPATLPQLPGHLHPQLNPIGPNSPDFGHFLQQPGFQFGPQFYPEENFISRHNSLSQQEQRELMQDLETEGMAGIDEYLDMASIAQYQNPLRQK